MVSLKMTPFFKTKNETIVYPEGFWQLAKLLDSLLTRVCLILL